jgi:hypothetical protein
MYEGAEISVPTGEKIGPIAEGFWRKLIDIQVSCPPPPPIPFIRLLLCLCIFHSTEVPLTNGRSPFNCRILVPESCAWSIDSIIESAEPLL